MSPPAGRAPAGGPGTVTVVGAHGGHLYGPGAADALAGADVVVGSPRQLASTAALRAPGATSVVLAGPLDPVLDRVAAEAAAGRSVCVLASGDPGFFGIVRVLRARLGAGPLAVHPAPSAVSLAFARLGTSWDDAAVVSAHGRPLAEAVAAVRASPNRAVAVLTSPDNPPQAVAAALVAAGEPDGPAAVACRLGEDGESVTVADLATVAGGTFDPLAVLVLTGRRPRPEGPGLAWGLPEAAFEHRDGMITKAEVRAVALGKLDLPSTGVVWDVGAGSGSVAIECARLRPGLRVIAVDRDPAQAQRIRANAVRHRVTITTVAGTAPEALGTLPDPDRAFVGGGGVDVLTAAVARLRPGGVAVATYAVVDRALAAASLLGNVVVLSVSRGVATGDLGLRLRAENPVFLCWGPGPGGVTP